MLYVGTFALGFLTGISHSWGMAIALGIGHSLFWAAILAMAGHKTP